MTKQEYYNKLVRAAKNGTFPSFMAEGSTQCAYRGYEPGTRCAIGLLIRNKDYRPEMEDRGVYELWNSLIIPDGMTENDLSDIQHIHDILASYKWDVPTFIQEINEMDCFKDVRKEKV